MSLNERDVHALLDVTHAGAGPRRRGLLRGALGLGYAAAAGPLVAQTAIKTPADGLVAGDVQIPVGA
ncbi:hypothetical protein U6L55_12400, partial [Cutibacterium acnes]